MKLSLKGLEGGEEGGEGQVRQNLNADREGIDEEADHVVDAVQRGRAAGDGQAEEDIGLGGIAGEEDGPGGLKESAERNMIEAGGSDEVGCSGGGEMDKGLIIAGKWERAVNGEGSGGREASEVGRPEGESMGRILSLEPGDVIAERAHGGQGGGAVGGEGLVGREDLFEEDGIGPAVEEEMVVSPDKEEREGGGADEGEAHQGSLRKVKTEQPVFLKKRI